MRQASRRCGFTLVELLVVVAIIALLISILLPSLQQARAQARQLLDVTNLRSQGQAVYQYAENNRGFIVRALAGFNDDDEWGSYAQMLLPYLGWTDHIPDWSEHNGLGNNAGLIRDIYEQIPFYQCPDHPDPRSTLDYVSHAMAIPYTQSALDLDQGQDQFGDDASDGVSSTVTDDSNYKAITQLDEIGNSKSPADTILATEAHISLSLGADGAGNWKDVRFHHFFLMSQLPLAGNPRIANDQRHPGGINAVFFDGHGETLGIKEMDPAWPADWDLRARWFTIFPAHLDP